MSRYILCTLIGAGTDVDRLRAPFPSYEMIAGPFGNKALVAIPDEDFKDENGDLPAANTQKLSAWLAGAGVPQGVIDRAVARYGDLDVTLAIAPTVRARLRQRLDRRYKEHAGEYDPSVG